jgi:hypothetical protein
VKCLEAFIPSAASHPGGDEKPDQECARELWQRRLSRLANRLEQTMVDSSTSSSEIAIVI